MSTTATQQQQEEQDPNKWLEDILSEKSLDWVKSRNAESISNLGDPSTTGLYSRILEILESKDRIPHAYRIRHDQYYNFWQDEDHVQGIWRRTTLDNLKKQAKGGGDDDIEWKTVLDLDAMEPPPSSGNNSTAKTWVWHGSTLLDQGPNKECDRALISLSPGGSDADITREFDLIQERFITEKGGEKGGGGFEVLTPSKSRMSYRSKDEVLIGIAFEDDTKTDSGYPRIIKSWKRGSSLQDAKTVFEVQKDDISASMYCYHDRGFVHEIQCRSITFYTSEYRYRLLTSRDLLERSADEEMVEFERVPIPEDADFGTFADSAMISFRTDFVVDDLKFVGGSLVVLPIQELMKGNWTNSKVLFQPSESRSLSSKTCTKDYVILKILQDVKTSLEFWRYDISSQSWTQEHNDNESSSDAVSIGEDVSISSHSRFDDDDNTLWLWRDGFLIPETQEMAHAEDGCTTTLKIKSKSDSFNSQDLCVEQHFATSADGTRIPYFLIRRSDLSFDGSHPTMVDAYGGFEISRLPGYSGGSGAAWLERGGVKVIANIRGGGEYGPKWHQAALKEKRYKCYEDMEAVAQDLIENLKITCPDKLACIGGSNGGLMVGNLLTRPLSSRLFGAAVCMVPLLDMKVYNKLLAGASWVAEYGDPDLDEEWVFLRKHSPYQMLRHDILGIPEYDNDDNLKKKKSDDPDWKCPKVLFTTSTRDDRVHPGHARKMVKSLLDEAGKERAPEVWYWENMEGGHGGAADNKQRAYMWTLTYQFLAKALGL